MKSDLLFKALGALAGLAFASVILIPLGCWWWWALKGIDPAIGQAWGVTWAFAVPAGCGLWFLAEEVEP